MRRFQDRPRHPLLIVAVLLVATIIVVLVWGDVDWGRGWDPSPELGP